jgi:hypothetical protein
MGMYTLLDLDVTFVEETPFWLLDAVEILVGEDYEVKQAVVKEVASSQNTDFGWTFRAYFVLTSFSCYHEDLGASFDPESRRLVVRSSQKNYEGEFEMLVKMISPYLVDGGRVFIGDVR